MTKIKTVRRCETIVAIKLAAKGKDEAEKALAKLAEQPWYQGGKAVAELADEAICEVSCRFGQRGAEYDVPPEVAADLAKYGLAAEVD